MGRWSDPPCQEIIENERSVISQIIGLFFYLHFELNELNNGGTAQQQSFKVTIWNAFIRDKHLEQVQYIASFMQTAYIWIDWSTKR